MLLTPNGRFELNTKICISFTNYHEELWQPAWGVRTAIIGLQGFFPLKGQAAMGVGALEVPTSERKRLASLSREWYCIRCNRSNLECLPDPPDSSDPSISDPLPEVETSLETEVVPNTTEAMPPQTAESNASVTVRDATPDGTDSAPRLESVDTTSVITPPPASAPTPPQNFSGGRGARQAAGPTPPFHPSQTHTIVRPPMLLDTAICVLLVLVFALLLRRIF